MKQTTISMALITQLIVCALLVFNCERALADGCESAVVTQSQETVEISIVDALASQTFSFISSATNFDGLTQINVIQNNGRSTKAGARVRPGDFFEVQSQVAILNGAPICVVDPFCDNRTVSNGNSTEPSGGGPTSSIGCSYCYSNISYRPVGFLARFRNIGGGDVAVIHREPNESIPSLTLVLTLSRVNGALQVEQTCVDPVETESDFISWLDSFALAQGFTGLNQIYENFFEQDICEVTSDPSADLCLLPMVGSFFSDGGGEIAADSVGNSAISSARKLLRKAERARVASRRITYLKKLARNLKSTQQGPQFLFAGQIASRASRIKSNRVRFARIWRALHTILG